MKQKTELTYTIKPNKGLLVFTPTAKTTTLTWSDEKNDFESKTVREKGKPTYAPLEPMGASTDYFASVVDELAPKMTYVALRTVYANSGEKMIWKLLCECIDYGRESRQTREAFEESVMQYLEKYNPTSLVEMREKSAVNHKVEREYTVSSGLKSEELNSETGFKFDHTMQKPVLKSYRMKRDLKGKLHKVECIPHFELEFTDFGKWAMSDAKIATGTNVEDLIQTARLAITELASYGLVKSYRQIWQYADYVYKAVNREINSNRRAWRNDSVEVITSTGEHKIMTSKAVDDKLEKVEKAVAVEAVKKTMLASLGKRENTENIAVAFDLLFVKGLDTRTVADRMKVGQTQVVRYKKSIEKALYSDEMHETLKTVIYG